GRAFLVIELVLLGCAAAVGWLAWPAKKPEAPVDIAFGFGLMIAYFGALASLTQAGAAVLRDAGVRELLAPLPLSPWDTLTGKSAAIRRLLWPLYASAIPLIVVALHHRHALGLAGVATVTWRAAFALAGVWIAADASVSVAFLTNGVGLPGARSLGAPTSWAPQLLLLPLLAAAAAPNALVALTSTATVAAVAFEARRAARRCVRWLDDASDDLERETTVWR